MSGSHPVIITEEVVTAILERAECGYALLGDTKQILYANRKWRFAESRDYLLRAIRASSGGKSEDRAGEIVSLFVGITDVLEGGKTLFEIEYACNEETYLLSVSSLHLQGQNMAVVQRVELTSRLALHHKRWEEQRLLTERERQIRVVLALEKMSMGEISTATAEIYGRMSLRESHPDIFRSLMEQYEAMLQQMADGHLHRIEYDISDRVRMMGDQLGLLHVGSRDLLDLHTHALRRAMVEADNAQSSALLEEGLRLALELMSYLVSHYRKYLWLNHSQAEYNER